MMLAVLLMATNYSYSQQDPIKVKGKVTDDKGEVLVGVSVIIKGTKTGTLTDVDGNYTIQAAPAEERDYSEDGRQPPRPVPADRIATGFARRDVDQSARPPSAAGFRRFRSG